MPDISDEQLHDLLRQAEVRLLVSSKDVTSTDGIPQPHPHSNTDDLVKRKAARPSEKLSVREIQKQAPQKQDNAGGNWFNLPKTDLTPEMKRDWQILRMRNILDPKHQKKSLSANPPVYSQVGEIIAGPTDFYSARISRKERKRNLLQEALTEQGGMKARSKSDDIRRQKASGKKAFYQRVVNQRRKSKG